MAININNLNSNANQVNNKTEQQNQLRQQADSSATAAKSAQQDSVSLTPQAKQLTDLHKKANDAAAVDDKKIERLKRAIASGEYKVDPEKLARSIINFELKLP